MSLGFRRPLCAASKQGESVRVFAGAVRVGRVQEHTVRGLAGWRKMISAASVDQNTFARLALL